MSDDLVTRLRHKYAGQLPICAEAADEIERLHKALALAVGELSTYAPYEDRSPENLFEFFKEAASHD